MTGLQQLNIVSFNLTQRWVRAALRANADGLTASELAQSLTINRRHVVTALAEMGDVYIDRWLKKPGKGKALWPVYVAVQVPENAPRPD